MSEKRDTFEIPAGYEAVRDAEGRATGEVKLIPKVPEAYKIFPIAIYDKIVKETIEKILELGVKKGGEYAGDSDRLANFRRNARAMGGDMPMETVWRVYVAKHWDAIMQYEQDLRTGKKRDRLETLDGRVDDIIVYLLLFKCMLRERGTDEAPGA